MPYKNLMLTDRRFQDLNPLLAGEEICPSGYKFGPKVRKYTLIHYVVSGCGTFYARGGVHPVHAGQAFIILPDEVTTYMADVENPWHYRWIGFDGDLAADFAKLPPVVTIPGMLFGRMMYLSENTTTAEYVLAGELFALYAHLFAKTRTGNRHVCRVENYIRTNYMRGIRVERLASDLGLDRRYLSRLFKEETGLSIQEYLIKIRMEEAENLLLRGCSVKETAHLVGYDDVSNFSKMFKKQYGIKPTEMEKRKP